MFMDSSSNSKLPNPVAINLQASEFTLTTGKSTQIVVSLSNTGTTGEYYLVSILDLPTGWLSPSGPSSIWLAPGAQEKVLFTITPPVPQGEAAQTYTGRVHVARQNAPDISQDLEVKLTFQPAGNIKAASSAFESQGRIGVSLSSIQFSAAPGDTVTIPIILVNRGLQKDTFRLGVEGIPLSWVSTAAPLTSLEPGEQKEISLLIQPVHSPTSQAGRNKFSLSVTSQSAPDQLVKVDCILTLAAVTRFSATLQPKQINAGQPVTVSVKNEGNFPQVFQLKLHSLDDRLLFEHLPPETSPQPLSTAVTQLHAPGSTPQVPGGNPAALTIAAGETASFRFSARPRQQPLISTGTVSYAYAASVKTQQKEGPLLQGQVVGHGMIPIWILPVAMALCAIVFLGAIILGNRTGSRAGSATQTSAAAGTAMVAGATQTIVANQTAAAIAGQQDTDGDGLINQRELELGTDPKNADSDNDGLLDGIEVYQLGTNPLNPDSDGDALIDGKEVQLKLNPLNPDTDGDGLRDGDELSLGTDPLKPDTDSDGLVDGAENQNCPNFLNPDTDGDGIIDGKDLNPCDPNNPALTATAASLLPTATVSPTSTPIPTSVPLPKFGGVILFVSSRDGNPEVYTLDDAGHIRRMTDNQAADIQAVWAPNLQRFAFTSNRDGQNEIYLMNADGTGLVNLTTNPADDQYPTWSVDGNWIAFSSNRDGNYEIYLLNVNTFETQNLTNNPANDTQPDWVNSTTFDLEGESILFTSDRDGNQEIYRIKTDRSEQVNLTANPANDQMAKGSPDGALVVFTSNRDGNQDIYSMRIDGKGATNLTNNPANDYGPCWAPSQAWVAFTTDRDGNNEVYITKSGNPELYNLTNNPNPDQVSDWR
ncbi:MAG: hypothetical protein C3F13_19550 [Anaerolineales bacterium]|nr:MAG: hypothetical protein C3F13_19550 [Anaerolineales bacterium]